MVVTTLGLAALELPLVVVLLAPATVFVLTLGLLERYIRAKALERFVDPGD